MTTTAMNATYINALLADASYVDLSTNINTRLTERLTKPLADFITTNFEVLNQTGVDAFLTLDGFSATVWRGKAGTDYAGQVYVSMRGTELGVDLFDDGWLALTGVAYMQITDMVNWWLRATTETDQLAPQLAVNPARVGRTRLRYAA